MKRTRSELIRYLIQVIDDHPASTEGNESVFLEQALRKFEAKGDLTDLEIKRLKKLRSILDSRLDLIDEDDEI